MYGAIIGDIVGSRFEFQGIKTKNFAFVTESCSITDDTGMTVAVANAILRSLEEKKPFKRLLVKEMQRIGRSYPNLGYGGMFHSWIFSDNPEPYYSYGNGSAMRVSPCGLIAVTLEEAVSLARASAEVTHNHPEGIRGAEATAAAVFLAKSGYDKESIAGYIRDHYYPLSKTLDQIRPTYGFDVTCQGSVPQAITAFLESTDYEDAIRNAVSLGGDSDTLGAITGGIAWAFYRVNCQENGLVKEFPRDKLPKVCERIIEENHIDPFLPDEFKSVIRKFEIACRKRAEEYAHTGKCSTIPLE
jgi:ADP-ribosylglycohydrolase